MLRANRQYFDIKELTDLYADGDIAIPVIQRDFVCLWGRDFVKAISCELLHRRRKKPKAVRRHL